ncbi:hypothetical protein C0Z18_14195 [Trinickia dabaoshanensis]|uniref:Uncharacterized protein n=1 Tax=Trinickia dabaoshanensis TaxID=564714 RepID=A0A2N7VQL3_9BURK|nr:hypothetical protein [Trinickia dabaoshanensis]PMS19459.1 hypothetical protein C0Z18_14195 [Trinickia dabaoshanensis]
MSSEHPVVADFLTWRAASKRSSPRWPALIGVCGTVVTLANLALGGNRTLDIGWLELDLFAAACIFGCLTFATFPVAYNDTARLLRGQPRLSAGKKWLTCIGLFLCALVVSPTFSVAIARFDLMHESRTNWTKRSLLESFKQPFYSEDELTWAQGKDDFRYVPSQVFCPSSSVRRYPLLGIDRVDDWPGVITNTMRDLNGNADAPLPDVLKFALSRCEAEGAAMLKAGYTKESALLNGNVDLFFTRLAQSREREGAWDQLVLEDAQIPPDIMRKVEALLAADPDHMSDYTDFNLDGTPPVARGLKPAAAGSPDVVRRLKPLAIAAALGRTKDVERIKAAE